MRIAVVAERSPETRVAVVPDLVLRYLTLGYDVAVEPGAGVLAGFTDERYVEAGAVVDGGAVASADLVLGVQALPPEIVTGLKAGAAAITLRATSAPTAFALDQVPRLSRAQPMDALTSQSLVAGYRAVVVAAELLPRFFPQAVTAAGTVPAAEVLVLGAGVAGLQAIATARRLGANVSGYDVRSSSAEEIASLGATPVDLGLPVLEGAAGYAREMTPERAAEQQRLLEPYVAAADVVITTAVVPGRTAPVLVTTEMVAAMRPGSVVVDIAGGNVAGAEPGSTSKIAGVTVWSDVDVARQLPTLASQLYAENVANLVALMTSPGAGFAPDAADEVVAGSRVRTG
ncbi:NAD(P) transhydrogenase subunit alpha [Marmoricola sp. OAE513]|uniref:NAD(P)(+) transhydrogenase (Re/Si-specific) subunit alpha n=1 Tax=Marmoricola sp. OAE513 TaxID=2817894 RepID=UPI001AE9E204